MGNQSASEPRECLSLSTGALVGAQDPCCWKDTVPVKALPRPVLPQITRRLWQVRSIVKDGGAPRSGTEGYCARFATHTHTHTRWAALTCAAVQPSLFRMFLGSLRYLTPAPTSRSPVDIVPTVPGTRRRHAGSCWVSGFLGFWGSGFQCPPTPSCSNARVRRVITRFATP